MHHRHRRATGLGLAVSLFAALAIGQSAAASPTFIFRIAYGDKCPQVIGSGGATGTITLYDAGGNAIEQQDLALDIDGNAAPCFDAELAAGMKVSATITGVTRSVTLPKLSLRIDRATDVLRGRAPAGKSVKLTVDHYTNFHNHALFGTSRTASSTGTYSKDVTSLVNIAGGDWVTAKYTNGSSDVFTVTEVAPRLEVWLGRSAFGGQLLSGTGGKVTLRTSAGAFRASGYLSWLSWRPDLVWDNTFFANAGSPVAVRTGDKVSSGLQSNLSFTVPTLTVNVDSATDLVSGKCPAGRPLRVQVTLDGSQVDEATRTCSAAGTYSADLTASHDLVAGERVEVTARLKTGDLVARRRFAA